ncbi:pigment-dispersing hormone type 1 [Cherax quadricarinatus]|uniref:Pigment dispersing hormone 2 n=1 Tax=Cherax quadricarinatus TaxID=27406 RepID=A0A2U8JAI3_CHEQU|nr:pigment dispersing hormone 2 [Cherax quadricarinatus]
MRGVVVVVVLVMVGMLSILTQAEGLKSQEREVVAELAAYILRVVHGPLNLYADLPSKRNSEILNTLLGSPTLMSEVGKR